MRLGPAAYDLASLLADPYVDREPGEQLALLEVYNRNADAPVRGEDYAAGAAQRLAQALGAYGRLGARPATRRFLDFVPAAVRQLSYWAPEGPLKQWAGAFFMRHPGEFAL
jgi:aminoglycoside/choline kinase family phosphotransferase